jgi:hypothetical protein
MEQTRFNVFWERRRRVERLRRLCQKCGYLADTLEQHPVVQRLRKYERWLWKLQCAESEAIRYANEVL